jgi:hypothetical protein
MAISPNVDFTSGQILTATQQNQFPRGIVALGTVTTAGAINSTESVQITSSAFTAVANRYYKVTYIEPQVQLGAATPGYYSFRIRLTNLAGAVQALCEPEPVPNPSDGQIMIMQYVGTFSAGSTVLVATASTNTSSASAYGAATVRRQLIVEDIGPA